MAPAFTSSPSLASRTGNLDTRARCSASTAVKVGGMRERFQARQPEKSASPFNGMDQPENVIEDLGVVRILLEPNELVVDRVQALVGFRQKLSQ